MSLYNQILGYHPFAKHLIMILGIHPNEYGRFRDIYLKKVDDKLIIVVFTRNGGGLLWKNKVPYYSLDKSNRYYYNFVQM